MAHNTVVTSDYGLLNDTDFSPKPNYWAALLWHRLMVPTVLDSGVPIQQGLHVYAHCQAGTAGGVSVPAVQDRQHPRMVDEAIAWWLLGRR
ncbi:MAG: hypothetical protein M3Y83_17830 [Actinomycetota bacterium]|nr:hypothetical protein [Actinomycetota bacterium]